MGLNVSKGNMYTWITHTWNAIKGKCPHDCLYCYMKKWGELNPARLDKKELTTDLGTGKFIFVGSSCDMFAEEIPRHWIEKTILQCQEYYSNNYLFQSKNPKRFFDFGYPENTVFCTTIETNRSYPGITDNCPTPQERAEAMSRLKGYDTYVTIEPIMNFDLFEMIDLIKLCKPKQVNIGSDSCGHRLPEPSKKNLIDLINALGSFTEIHNKNNLKRLLK